MKTTLIRMMWCLVIGLSCSPVLAATADGGFEFSHRPADDGAGYVIQPLTNIRADGSMAIEVGQTLALPGFPTVNGRGTNNGGGTFSYSGATATAMGYIQAAAEGQNNGSIPPVSTPFNGTKTFTVEARFKVSGDRSTAANQDLFCIEHNALGSTHFSFCYGRQGADGTGTLTLSPVGGTFASSGTTIPMDLGTFNTMRIVSMDTGGGTAMLSTYIDLEDGSGWRTGPTASYTPSTTRDRGALIRTLTSGGTGGANPTTTEVDYIRWKLAKVETTEALNAVPEPASLGVAALGVAGLFMARRRRS